jgi:nitrilase
MMMHDPNSPFLIAAIQATPVFLDRAATVEKACALIAEAGRNGARLAVFPEGFIPTYPLWTWFIPPYRTQELRELYAELLDNSIALNDSEVDQLCRAAADARVNVVMGINERNVEASGTTLYNSLLFIGEDGTLLGCHRKLVPTVAERLVHGQGDGSTLRVYDLPIGKLAGLVCWENYMPLARYALYAWGAQIYVAPTWDRGEPWISTLRHIAKEGRVYVVGSCTPMRRDDIPDRYAFKDAWLPATEWLNPGESTIIDPDGKFIVEPVRNREEILYAEIDPAKMKGPRYQLDVAGHYGRPDLFELTVHRNARQMVRVVDRSTGHGDAREVDGSGGEPAQRATSDEDRK